MSDRTVARLHERVSRATTTVGAFDAFFAAASAGLLLLDGELRCVRVNEALAHLTGIALEDHAGHPVRDILPSTLEPKLQHVLASHQPIDKVPLELGGRSLLGTFFPVYGDGDRIVGLGGILIDLTEHHRLENELRAAIEIRERVLAIVSHDLRNPVSTIQLATSTLPDEVAANADANRPIEMIERATRTMETLINDLLDMATIQTGTLVLRLADESAESILHETIQLHGPLAERRGVSLVDSTELAGVRVRCDRARILQVLGNLIGNAIKFCKAGDMITLRGRADERTLTLAVADSGPGIPADDIPHLFEPYWSTARDRQRGTGLGLYICHAIVDAHGGTLTVESKLGVGTTFFISLPLG
jgi:signal transduction histidine kinase